MKEQNCPAWLDLAIGELVRLEEENRMLQDAKSAEFSSQQHMELENTKDLAKRYHKEMLKAEAKVRSLYAENEQLKQMCQKFYALSNELTKQIHDSIK